MDTEQSYLHKGMYSINTSYVQYIIVSYIGILYNECHNKYKASQ